MLLTEGIVLGHHVSFSGIKLDPATIEVMVKLHALVTQKDVRSFLGHASYYRRLIENFTKMTSPLFKRINKDVDFYWDTNCQIAFDTLKDKIMRPRYYED